MQRLRSLFGKNKNKKMCQTDPLKPDFDIDAWLDRRQELREKDPENIDRFIPTGPALLLGFSDCVTPEQDAEQNRQLAEWERQQEEAKRVPPPTNVRAS